jgi:outer membrane biosynthesis protein TonB
VRRHALSLSVSLAAHGLLVVATLPPWPPKARPPDVVEMDVRTLAASMRKSTPTVVTIGSSPRPERLRSRPFPQRIRGGAPHGAPHAHPEEARPRPSPAPETPAATPTPPPALPPDPESEPRPVAAPTPVVVQAPALDADRSFDDLVRAQHRRLAAGGDVGNRGPGSDGTGGGRLAFQAEVSGRRVENSRAVAAPVVLQEQPVECELPKGSALRAVVRTLVIQHGTTVLQSMLESSGNAAFDGCALRYVRSMRFAPGRDFEGNALNVWVNVRVALVLGGRIGAAKERTP